MSVPFDGTPDGDLIGFHMEADRRRMHDAIVEAAMETSDTPQTPLQLIAFLLGACVVLVVMLYGNVG